MNNIVPRTVAGNTSCRLDARHVNFQCLPVPLDRLAETLGERGVRCVDVQTTLNAALRVGELRLGHTDGAVLVISAEGAAP